MFGRKKKADDVAGIILTVKGSGGRIELYRDRVELYRKGCLSFILLGHQGVKTIYLHQLSGVQLKKPGITSGYLQLVYLGSQEHKGGLFSATSDENTLFLKSKKQYEEAVEFKQEVERILSRRAASSGASNISIADELEKLASLKSRGVISDKEFKEQRERLLG